VITLNKCAHGITVPKETDTHAQGFTSTPFPNLAVHQAVCFDNPTALYSLSCLQMTATGLFVTWKSQSPHLSDMLQSSGHRPSSDAAQFSLVDDGEWEGEALDDSQGSGELLGDVLATSVTNDDKPMSADDDVHHVLGSTVESTSPVQMAGPSTQLLFGGEPEDSDDPVPEFQNVFDSSDDDGDYSSDDTDDQLHDISPTTVVFIDFLPE